MTFSLILTWQFTILGVCYCKKQIDIDFRVGVDKNSTFNENMFGPSTRENRCFLVHYFKENFKIRRDHTVS